MAIVSAPPERMTETAAGLLAAAAALGYPATVVATTGDTPLGLGFQVPDEVADKWHAEGVVSVPVGTLGTMEVPVSELFDKIDDPEVLPIIVEVSEEVFDRIKESPETPSMVLVAPQGDPEETKAAEAPQKRGPGRPRKPVTEGPEV